MHFWAKNGNILFLILHGNEASQKENSDSSKSSCHGSWYRSSVGPTPGTLALSERLLQSLVSSHQAHTNSQVLKSIPKSTVNNFDDLLWKFNF